MKLKNWPQGLQEPSHDPVTTGADSMGGQWRVRFWRDSPAGLLSSTRDVRSTCWVAGTCHSHMSKPQWQLVGSVKKRGEFQHWRGKDRAAESSAQCLAFRFCPHGLPLFRLSTISSSLQTTQALLGCQRTLTSGRSHQSPSTESQNA